MSTEIWKDIPNYEGLYKINNYGKIKRLPFNRYIKTHNEKGYIRVALCKNNKVKHLYLHRLIALTFIPNPENKPEVNHKDGNKLNNNINNLEWSTRKENMNHARDTGLWKVTKNMKKGLDQSKATYQYNRCYRLLNVYNSAKEASLRTKINHGNICACCEGRRKTAGGYIWSYLKEGGDYHKSMVISVK